jgi:TetR/AcrR family transcriptional repressor of nem operon
MEVFWEKGFQGTSMQDLVDRMGINRGSLYDTFGNKEALYHAAVDRYCAQRTEGMLDLLARPGEPRAVLEAFFAQVIDNVTGPKSNGCMMTNAAVELGNQCARTSEKAVANRVRMEEAFSALVARQPDLGADPQAVARFLVGMLSALTVTAKAAPRPGELEDMVRVALTVLE